MLLAGTENKYTMREPLMDAIRIRLPFTVWRFQTRWTLTRILTTPASKERIDLRAKNAIYLNFPHTGTFPGKATVTVNLGGSGVYMLYHYDKNKDDFPS